MIRTIAKLKFRHPCGMDEVRRWIRRWNARDQKYRCLLFGLDYTSVRERSSILMDSEPDMPEWKADRLALRYELESHGVKFDYTMEQFWERSWFHRLMVDLGVKRRLAIRSIRKKARARR